MSFVHIKKTIYETITGPSYRPESVVVWLLNGSRARGSFAI